MVFFNVLRQAGPLLASRHLRPSVLPVVSQLMANPTTSTTTSSPQLFNLQNHQQVRTRMTKRKRHILAKKKKWAALALQGIFPPRPPSYLDKNEPVINAKTREQRDAEAKAADVKASIELKARMQAMEEKAQPPLRFHMEGITMSDRVRKLFDLTNGNQKEAVKAQKRKGMELFQVREGDTGSSAVQVIALTTRIQQMQQHMKTHRKDKSSKRGMDALFVRRRKLLDYMERKEFDSYRRVVKTLGLVR